MHDMTFPIKVGVMNEIEAFLNQIEAFIAEKGMTPTSFGRKYAGDNSFVFQLREGREPRLKTRRKVSAAMAQYQEAAE